MRLGKIKLGQQILGLIEPAACCGGEQAAFRQGVIAGQFGALA